MAKFIIWRCYLGRTVAANYLDDYEERIFFYWFSFATRTTITNGTATYTKIGRLVTINLYLLVWNKGLPKKEQVIAVISKLTFNSKAVLRQMIYVLVIFNVGNTAYAQFEVLALTTSNIYIALGLMQGSNLSIEHDLCNTTVYVHCFR